MLGETLASSWQLDSFIRAFPLEYCAALLIRRLLALPADLPSRTREDIASLCDFEHGPTVGGLHWRGGRRRSLCCEVQSAFRDRSDTYPQDIGVCDFPSG